MPYKVHSVVIDPASYGVADANTITDVTNSSIANNPQLEAIVTAGETMATHAILRAQAMSGDFTSLAVARTIDAIGLQPLCITTDNTHVGVQFYLSAIDNCGAVSSTGHRSFTISSGSVFPRRLTCEHRGDAQISCDVVISKNSVNNPVVLDDNAALPDLDDSGTLYGGNLWTIGPAKVGNVTLSDYTGIDIDFGNAVSTRGSESEVWDSHVESVSHRPTITLRGIDPTWFKESGGVPTAGLACTHANTIIYLRKRVQGSPAFVADNAAEHVKFTAKGIATIQQVMSGATNQFTETSLTIQCVYDGTDDPIEVDTTSAIA